MRTAAGLIEFTYGLEFAETGPQLVPDRRRGWAEADESLPGGLMRGDEPGSCAKLQSGRLGSSPEMAEPAARAAAGAPKLDTSNSADAGIKVIRRDRLGGLIHEYAQVA
jgi:hypothetical protein